MIPLQLPVGIYRNGTDYQSKGRWFDSNLIRFENNTIKPINGWRQKSDSSITDVVRGACTWRDNSGNLWLSAGTSSKLYVYNISGIQYDITPTGLVSGRVDSTSPTGFGNTLYGTSYYGVERPVRDAPLMATTWDLDNFGQNLIACSVDDGKVYEWTLDTAQVATQVTNAPVDNTGIIITAERFLFCLAAENNPKLIKWSDREDINTWDPLATNEAGDLELQTSGEILCAVRVQGETLILTTTDAHTAQYQGPPYVYGFDKVGSSCGIISRKAVSSIDQGAIWMSEGSFHIYAGGKVQNLPCEVSDHIFTNLNTAQKSKVYSVSISKKSEVWWFYPSGDSIENNKYVIYNYKENCWYIGDIERTAAVDAGVFSKPIMFDTTKLYDHEIGFNYDGSSPFIESGPIEIGNGDNVMMINSMIPDEVTQGEVYAEFFSKFYPNGDEYSHGVYNMSNPTDLRVTGRQIRVRLTANENTDWRVGINRLELKQGGRR